MSLQGPSKGIDAMSDDERMEAAQKLNFKKKVSLLKGLRIQPLASVPNFCLGGRAQREPARNGAFHTCVRARVYIYIY